MKKNILMYLSIMFSYTIVDIVYQVLVGFRITPAIYDNAGLSDILVSDAPNHVATVPLFFLMIALVLLVLVVKPAIERKSIGFAISRASLVGLAAYGTYGLVFLWLLDGYPIAAFFLGLLEGQLFPIISSLFTTWLFLRKSK